MANKTPLEKISVNSIVKECGLNRKTFYYHFQDKYDLVCWIFDNEFTALVDTNNNRSVIDEFVGHLYANKEFYAAALASDAQNNLRDHFYSIVYNAMMKNIELLLETRKMDPDRMKLIASYFAHAVIGFIVEWAKEGMKTPPEAYDTIFYTITGKCMDFIINEFCENKC